MGDYGHELTFGTFIAPESRRPLEIVELARVTERAGLDLVTFMDHPYQPAMLDTWTLLSYVGAATRACPSLGLRPEPAVAPARGPGALGGEPRLAFRGACRAGHRPGRHLRS